MGMRTKGSWDGTGLPGQAAQADDAAVYGFIKHLEYHGSGRNLLRTERIVQPRALLPGDILATGEKVLSAPRTGYNSIVLVHLSGIPGKYTERWTELAARLPLALNAPGETADPDIERTLKFSLPGKLQASDIIGDGDEVLADPCEGFGEDTGNIILILTGGFEGHRIDVPPYVPIALLTEEDGPPAELWNHGLENRPTQGPYKQK
jgi:hypothetical protein